jgi:hypothetical protein
MTGSIRASQQGLERVDRARQLVSLERRSLLDKIAEANGVAFTLQPMVMKYVAEEFIEQVIDEIESAIESQDIKTFKFFRKYALIKPQPNDKSNSEIDRWMITRLRDSLMINCDCEVGLEIKEIVPLLRGKALPVLGYLSRNLLEILKILEVETDSDEWRDIPIR